MLLSRLPKTSSLIQKFTVEMEKSVLVTVTAMTLTHQKTRSKDTYDF